MALQLIDISSTWCSACCLGHLQRRHRCRHHSPSRPSVARGGLPSRGLTVACARDVADCRGSVHLGRALMHSHRQQQASTLHCSVLASTSFRTLTVRLAAVAPRRAFRMFVCVCVCNVVAGAHRHLIHRVCYGASASDYGRRRNAQEWHSGARELVH